MSDFIKTGGQYDQQGFSATVRQKQDYYWRESHGGQMDSNFQSFSVCACVVKYIITTGLLSAKAMSPLIVTILADSSTKTLLSALSAYRLGLSKMLKGSLK